VTLLRVDKNGLFYPQSDSRTEKEAPSNDTLAQGSIDAKHAHDEIAPLGSEEVAQVAQPFFGGRGKDKHPTAVVLYSRDLNDVAEAVDLVRNRVLVATGVALALAMAGAFLVAQALARRVRRLELAANEVAHGRFIDPLPVDSKDELGQLTRTFNQMQAQLQQVDVARKEFIATASHELRTPIFSLAVSVDLLDLSRLDAGSVELHPEPVDLAELARSIVNEFTPALADHNTELEINLPTHGPEALCDPVRVAQIMRILLDNALRHTPSGTQVTVASQRRNGTAGLTVTDSGPGLPDHTDTKVFERFYTGDAARGAGLGLAIARELAERMHGRRRVSSASEGTAFTLELPSGGNGA
jgi:two-component system OmpR family sensor kinase